MFENIVNFFKKLKKTDKSTDSKSKETAKERLHLVLMQDRANVSADFLDMMKQEIIEVIKKYIDIDEKAIDVKLTNKMNEDGTVGAPALYANIPIVTIKNDARKVSKEDETDNTTENASEEVKTEDNNVEENVDTNEETAEIKVEEPDTEKNNNNAENESGTEKENLDNNQKESLAEVEGEPKIELPEEDEKKENANK